MSTNSAIIEDALNLAGILRESESLSAEQASHGLRVLNQMMAAWAADDVVIGYFEQTSPSAVCPIPDWAEKGVYGQLALDLAATYKAPIDPAAAKVAMDGYEVILRTLMNQRQVGADLSHLGSGQGRYDILTDA